MTNTTTVTKPTAEELLSLMSNPTEADKLLVRKAFDFAREAHKDHKRNSGEPYFSHLFATATALAELDMDAPTVAAGLLHDTVEDTPVTHKQIEEEFGAEVTFLVDGVTKLGELKYRGASRHVESLRRLFVATSKDIRVLMIKLMDRRHNMQTLMHVPAEKRERIAKETLTIYAPLADRLGMGRIKGELEDLAFQYVYPEDYKKITEIIRENKIAREPQLEKVTNVLKRALAEHNIHGFRTESRIKGLYSLFTKLKRKDGDIEKIHDLLAVRVILTSVEDCYRALGVVHTLWHPLPGKIKDYIAFPKPNGYRSIHTTVVTSDAGPVEVQLRTDRMHSDAQYGFASHLSYKEVGDNRDRGEQKRNRLWYKQLIPSLLRTHTPTQTSRTKDAPRWVEDLATAHDVDPIEQSEFFMQEIQDDFFSHRIFIFTPKGDVIDLPANSSPIDFAYAIHSEIGDHMAGAKVNGKLVSLDTKLKNGDIVEIETRPSAKPSNKWLGYARTTMARRHIQQYLGQQERI
ncbi:MAG: bifunctional (p)ppGpp synthetase/guanosine-3',5'-bis(diphosphate) 3'-pyrophosphohydrolase [Candidatus Pacebacteria bacterium]|nr:bifunctional (p)ppGpp synthetase/guanosine-3',5'-bis(diphosphate) 3'-pyrophosphohydrolase [Candidatus Paceibacterota bacterium]